MNGVKKENNNRSKASTIKLDNLKSNQKKIVNTLEKKDFLGKKQQSDKAKKQESPINTIVEDLKKTRPLTKKIKQVTISQSGEINMKESGVNKLQHEKDLENSHSTSRFKKKYICKHCPKATVLSIGLECTGCGLPNETTQVLCDDDMTNGSRKLRDQNSVLCKNSPYYYLIVKNEGKVLCEKSPDYDLILKKVF